MCEQTIFHCVLSEMMRVCQMIHSASHQISCRAEEREEIH